MSPAMRTQRPLPTHAPAPTPTPPAPAPAPPSPVSDLYSFPSDDRDSPPPLTEDDDDEDTDSMYSPHASTSGDKGARSASPTLSDAPSAYSYASSVDSETMLRELYGRTLNNTNSNYLLPADAVEHGRLDIQHEMLKRKMNGIFTRGDAVRRAMAPRKGTRPAALDIGTGSGSWAIDMGRHFPHAEIVGLDLAPAILSRPPPPNCRFECDDVNLGLSHYRNSFDVVHMRCVTSGLEDYKTTLEEVGEVLRAGGVYLMMEGNLTTYDSNFEPMHVEDERLPGFSFYSKMANAVLTAVKTKRPNVDSFHSVPKWLKEMDGTFEETGEKNFFIPIGPWEENMTEKQKYISELMRQDIFKVASAFRPLLLAHGYFPETVDRWIFKTQDELLNLKVHMYVKWHCCWAIKRRAIRS